jgi:hypothetical protein
MRRSRNIFKKLTVKLRSLKPLISRIYSLISSTSLFPIASLRLNIQSIFSSVSDGVTFATFNTSITKKQNLKVAKQSIIAL